MHTDFSGFAAGQGPGAGNVLGTLGAGGAHGGRSGRTRDGYYSAPAYDSIHRPRMKGSGGGGGGRGGGKNTVSKSWIPSI